MNILLGFDVISGVEESIVTPQNFVSCLLSSDVINVTKTSSNTTIFDLESKTYVHAFELEKLSPRFEVTLMCYNMSVVCNITVDLSLQKKAAVESGCSCIFNPGNSKVSLCLANSQTVSDWLFIWPYVFIPINVLGFATSCLICMFELVSRVTKDVSCPFRLSGTDLWDTRWISILSMFASIGELLTLSGIWASSSSIPTYLLPTSLLLAMLIKNAHLTVSSLIDLENFRVGECPSSFDFETVRRWGGKEARCIQDLSEYQITFLKLLLFVDFWTVMLSSSIVFRGTFIQLKATSDSSVGVDSPESWERIINVFYIFIVLLFFVVLGILYIFFMVAEIWKIFLIPRLSLDNNLSASTAIRSLSWWADPLDDKPRQDYLLLRLKIEDFTKLLHGSIRISKQFLYERPVQFLTFKGLQKLTEFEHRGYYEE